MINCIKCLLHGIVKIGCIILSINNNLAYAVFGQDSVLRVLLASLSSTTEITSFNDFPNESKYFINFSFPPQSLEFVLA
ncbi:MAG: hypothetical protein HWD59_10830 [Coxiellaceae bacterium]|nr:MAG: hypothetical protein HWD59_10830 [Coxiellaceae bacterium]